MAETAILNPVRGLTPGTTDNWNPDYAFTRKSAKNGAEARPRLGSWYQRDVLNAGHSFSMSWIARPWSTILRVLAFYNDYKGGYFTYIDWDKGERHHVGRFTSEPEPMEVANGKFTVQGLAFEEVPQARMLNYPADFVNWGRTLNAVDDNLVPTASWYSNPLGSGAWLAIVDPPINTTASPTDPSAYVTYTNSEYPGDWAQMQYVGWGFEMVFRTYAYQGLCHVYVDGALYAQNVDLSGPAATVTISNTRMPLDVHRVKVAALAQSGAHSAVGGVSVKLPQLKVIV